MNESLDIYVSRCINCGFCDAVCPTLEAADFRGYFGARGRVNLAKELIKNDIGEEEVLDSFNSCLHCNACLYVCPAGISAGEISEKLKLRSSKKDPLAKFIAENIMKYKDPLNIGKGSTLWSKGLKFNEQSEYLFYTARMYQLMPYNSAVAKMREKLGEGLLKKFSPTFSKLGFKGSLLKIFLEREKVKEFNNILLNIYKVLAESGVELRYLGEEEPYSGAMLLEFGFEKEFTSYANWLVNFFKSKNIKKIVTIDPHTYTLLKYQIKDYVNFPFEVIFYLDLVNKKANFSGTVTIHQACHLERYGEKYRKYYDILSDVRIINPIHFNERTFCCGGPDEVLFPNLTNKISEKRFIELKSTEADYIITMCPICYINLKKDEKVIDISQFIAKF
ncbi:MAG: (Fe-S)-binding protein [Thermoplasmatales archaeon]